MIARMITIMNAAVEYVIHLLVSGLAVLAAAYVLPGVGVSGFGVALITAVIIGVVNMFVRPLFVLLTLPITLLSMGLFVLVINGLLILLVGVLVPGFTVSNFWWAALFSIVLALVNGFLSGLYDRG
jgi:putative membrane protein